MPVDSVGSTGSTGTTPTQRNQRTERDVANLRETERRETPRDRGRTESRNSYGDRAETSRGR